jgi:hypothetical protein
VLVSLVDSWRLERTAADQRAASLAESGQNLAAVRLARQSAHESPPLPILRGEPTIASLSSVKLSLTSPIFSNLQARPTVSVSVCVCVCVGIP